jgi:hypothetical protein
MNARGAPPRETNIARRQGAPTPLGDILPFADILPNRPQRL